MEFKDFKDNPKDLVGKTVLYESGFVYSENKNRRLLKIEKVTKTGFRLSDLPQSLFSLTDGRLKGRSGKMDMSYYSHCTLLTDEEANHIRDNWRRNREERELREKMKSKIDTMTYEQLKKVESI